MARGKHVELTGFKQLRDTLTNLAPREVNNIMRAAVHGLAGKVRDELKGAVKERTGALKKSLKVVRRRGKPGAPVSEVRGGSTAPYMLMLEFGTRHTRAQPFITPTVERMRPDMEEEFREQFGKKLERSLAKKGGK